MYKKCRQGNIRHPVTILLAVLLIAFAFREGIRAAEKSDQIQDVSVLDFQYNGHTYALYSLRAAGVYNLDSYEAFCNEAGGYPAVISSQDENTIIYNQLLASGYETAFFGYMNQGSPYIWTWQGREDSRFSFWSSRALDKLNEQNGISQCARFHSVMLNGQWEPAVMSGQGDYFLCEWDYEKDDRDDAQMVSVPAGNMFSYNGILYALIQEDDYHFDEADIENVHDGYTAYRALCEFCYVRNAHPALIRNKVMNDYLYARVLEKGEESAFFGYSAWENEEDPVWSWTWGSSTYENWAEGQPDFGGDNPDDERFAQFMIGGNGKWNDAAFGIYTKAFLIEWND